MKQSFMRNFIAHLARRIEEDSNECSDMDLPAFILTVWKKSQLSAGWEEELGNFDAISVKVMDGAKQYDHKGVDSLVSTFKDSPVDVHGWGYHYCQEPSRARDEAIATAIRCQELGISHYHWNAEKHWKAGIGPVDENAIVFARSFQKEMPSITLYANCFNAQTTSKMAKHFNYFEPMCYGTKRKTIASKVAKRMSGKPFPAGRTGIMVGTGRPRGGSSSQYWGYTTPPEGKEGPWGLVQLVAAHKPAFVNFFRAGVIDGQDMLMAGNAVNPKMSEQIGLVLDHLGRPQV